MLAPSYCSADFLNMNVDLAASGYCHDAPERRWRDRNFSLSNPPMPWFGVDIGGTLVKLVYFEPTDGHSDDVNEIPIVTKIRKYLTSNTSYGETGIRDAHLQLENQLINGRVGTLHFIRFPVSSMLVFIKLAQAKGLAVSASTVSATGGGAFKFEKIIKEELDLELFKYDELQSLIAGIQYIVENHPGECYYFTNPLNDTSWSKISYQQPLHTPYLVVNVGSGVSVLCVDGHDKFRRVTGTSLGGGMFHGLCSLLTGCHTFEEAIELASRGDNNRVDRLIRDIYGGDYELFSLPGDTVAASFGLMIDPERRKEARPEDLARSALVTITNNIGSIAKMCAQNLGIEKILFVGNFLRVNTLSMRQLASAMDYWSAGKIKALFLQHEGYFGAIGCLMNLMRLSEARKSKKLSMQQHANKAMTSSTAVNNATTSSSTVTSNNAMTSSTVTNISINCRYVDASGNNNSVSLSDHYRKKP